MNRYKLLAAAALVTFAWGCASDEYNDPFEAQKKEHDRLWRQGYGFNNPNVERIRKGEPTVGWGEEKKKD